MKDEELKEEEIERKESGSISNPSKSAHLGEMESKLMQFIESELV
jgi:hypothetical protein